MKSDLEPVQFSPPRETWPPGPWDTEPDRLDFTTQAGYAGLLLRNEMGAWCGYVGVPEGHPLHGLQYNQCAHRCPPDAPLDAPECPRNDDLPGDVVEAATAVSTRLESLGFHHWKCTSSGHPSPDSLLRCHGGITYSNACAGHICHPADEGAPPVHWLGFDCGHGGDIMPGMLATRRLMYEAAEKKGDLESMKLWGAEAPLWPWGESYKDMSYAQAEVEALAEQLLRVEAIGVEAFAAMEAQDG